MIKYYSVKDARSRDKRAISADLARAGRAAFGNTRELNNNRGTNVTELCLIGNHIDKTARNR